MTAFVLLLNKKTIRIYAELAISGFDHDKNSKRYRSPYPALCFFSWRDSLSVACCFRHFLAEQQLITTLRISVMYRFLKLPVLCCQSAHAYLPISVCKLCAERPLMTALPSVFYRRQPHAEGEAVNGWDSATECHVPYVPPFHIPL